MREQQQTPRRNALVSKERSDNSHLWTRCSALQSGCTQRVGTGSLLLYLFKAERLNIQSSLELWWITKGFPGRGASDSWFDAGSAPHGPTARFYLQNHIRLVRLQVRSEEYTGSDADFLLDHPQAACSLDRNKMNRLRFSLKNCSARASP